MKSFWKKYRIRLMIAVAITVVSSILRGSGYVDFTPPEQVLWAFLTFVIFWLMWEIFARINTALNKKLPFADNPIKRIVAQFFCNWLVLLVSRWTGIYFLIDHFRFPFTHVNYVMIFATDMIASAGLTLAFAASFFFNRWKESLVNNERLEKEKSQMQVHNLRNRVNPHFLFNALSALDGLIKTQPELASKFLQHLSKVYRYSLQHEDRESVSLDTEYLVFKHFVSLLEIRYGSALRMHIALTSDAMDKGIVPLTLEMLTENALKHNEISDENPLRIRIYNSDDELIIENSLRKKKTLETSNGKGLSQLQNLYRFLSDRPFTAREEEHLFVVKLPLL